MSIRYDLAILIYVYHNTFTFNHRLVLVLKFSKKNIFQQENRLLIKVSADITQLYHRKNIYVQKGLLKRKDKHWQGDFVKAEGEITVILYFKVFLYFLQTTNFTKIVASITKIWQKFMTKSEWMLCFLSRYCNLNHLGVDSLAVRNLTAIIHNVP